jgi:cyanobactin biosynthesis protein (PatB/AcyB/McaB family)
MYGPIQAPPVRRPDLVDARKFYSDVVGMTKDQVELMQRKFAFDLNFNDPQAFAFPSADRMRVSSWPGL